MRNRRKILIAAVILCVIAIAMCVILRDEKSAEGDRTLDMEIPEEPVETADPVVNNDPQDGLVVVEGIQGTEDIVGEKKIQETDDSSVDHFNVFYGVVYVPDAEIDYSVSEKVFYTKDQKPVLSCKYSYPVLMKFANEEARKKINSSMERMMEDWYEEKKTEAEKDEQGFYESGEGWDYHWESKSECTVYCGRVDPVIISFYVERYDFYGGAHGFLTSTAISFDGKTGEVLSLKDICLDKDEFIGSCKDYILARPFLWGINSQDKMSSLIENIIERGSFYYAHEGFVLSTDVYELGGNVDGCVQLVIPYDSLKGSNYKYDYFGNVSRAFRAGYEDLNGMTACVDLDGDHEDEKIYVDKVFDGEDAMNGIYKIYINDEDFSDVISKYQIRKSGTGYDWYIEDVDSGDLYCEIFLRLDESMLVLRYEGNKLRLLGEVRGCPSIHDSGFQVNGDGIIKCDNEDYVIVNGNIVSNN